jgi:hypothetical protein
LVYLEQKIMLLILARLYETNIFGVTCKRERREEFANMLVMLGQVICIPCAPFQEGTLRCELIVLRVARGLPATNFLASVIKIASEISIQDLENEAVARTVLLLIIGQLRRCREHPARAAR